MKIGVHLIARIYILIDLLTLTEIDERETKPRQKAPQDVYSIGLPPLFSSRDMRLQIQEGAAKH